MLASLDRTTSLVQPAKPTGGNAELPASAFAMRIASSPDEIEEAQRLRYQVFF